MAYFDSKKNRALWEIELQGLRKEKAERAAGKVPQRLAREEKKNSHDRQAIRTSYKELLREESLAMQKAPKKEHLQRERSKSMEVAKERQKEGMIHDMR